MPSFIKPYFDTEGPFGLPMKDKQARALEQRLREVPKEAAYAFRRLSVGRGLSELQAGERADVSWITEETPDRHGDIVLAAGMDDAHFKLNPIVTLNHCYWQPPVGKSLWRRRVREGALRGVKAKTHYPPRPDQWPADDWLPDYAYELVRAGLLLGKSIGFFPLKVRVPTPEEIDRRPEMKQVRYVIEQWLLAEYACCYLPVQPNAVVAEVSKALGEKTEVRRQKSEDRREEKEVRRQKSEARSEETEGRGEKTEDRKQKGEVGSKGGKGDMIGETRVIPFTALPEVEKALRRCIRQVEVRKILQNSFLLSYQRAEGMW